QARTIASCATSSAVAGSAQSRKAMTYRRGRCRAHSTSKAARSPVAARSISASSGGSGRSLWVGVTSDIWVREQGRAEQHVPYTSRPAKTHASFVPRFAPRAAPAFATSRTKWTIRRTQSCVGAANMQISPARKHWGAYRVSDIILETSGLTREFSGFVAVDGVDLKVREGTIHALIGPNGAGKTTCFNMLTKFLPPTRGSIRFKGEDITGKRPAQVARLGLARSFQISAVFPHLTAIENVRLALQRARGNSYD